MHIGKKLLILRRHLAGKQAERLFDQRLNAAEIVGQRAQRHARAGGDFPVRNRMNAVYRDRVQRRLQNPLPPLRVVWSTDHQCSSLI